ncbi:MAG TPA: DUF1778 domain-containing protein [Candidatus Acidoferrum sp.]|nr:DUF1778 domain-containing protein [Candidatus Acidoferrum sp.]
MALVMTKGTKRLRKSTRVEARLNPEQKRRIEHAAGLKGTSISEFIVSSADDAAVRAIEQHEVWVLAGRDREAFVKALVRPPAPNRRLRTALRRYNAIVSKT